VSWSWDFDLWLMLKDLRPKPKNPGQQFPLLKYQMTIETLFGGMDD